MYVTAAALGLSVLLLGCSVPVSAQQCGAATTAAAEAPLAAGPQSSRCSYIDITVTVQPGMPVWEEATGLPEDWRVKHHDMADGDEVNQSRLSLDAHTGTHVDAAVHFVNEAYEYGGTVENLDINTLIGAQQSAAGPAQPSCWDSRVLCCGTAGPALVVRVPSGSNITSEQLVSHYSKGSPTPRGATRLALAI